MGVRLEKLSLPTNEQIDLLAMPELLSLAKNWRERLELYQEQLFRERRHRYGRSSERSPRTDEGDSGGEKSREETTKCPSERYPNAPVHVEKVDFSAPPPCPCCGAAMTDSGMTEDSESIGVREKQFIVIDQKRSKYRCGKCHGTIVTAPAPVRVTWRHALVWWAFPRRV